MRSMWASDRGADVTNPPDLLAVARACVAAAQASEDPETSAYYLARATLSLRTLETETAELRITLAAVEREAVRRWRGMQPEDAKP
jgi:hypothetical protein